MTWTFDCAKQAVCHVTRLSHPDLQAAVSLAVDAADSHVGTVLQQRRGGTWQHLSFFSKK
jgi:hypothetical protein